MACNIACSIAIQQAPHLTGLHGGSVGALAPGMVADLIAVNGDPLADLAVLQRVRVVVSRGRVVKHS